MTPLRRSTLLLILLFSAVVVHFPAAAQHTPATGNANYRLHLPQLASPPAANVFGIEMNRINSAKGLDLLRSTSTTWVRRNALLWRNVELSPGAEYVWDARAVQLLEEDLRNAAEAGLKVVLIVRGSPRWAVAPYEADCAPINEQSYDDFARFLAAAVERYSKPPFNVEYWELGNEPDTYIFPQNAVFGCWGVQSDPYYGGEAYGRMLRAVVPAMKAANPRIKVLNGGLLLFRPYDSSDPKSNAGRFFEGVLRAGGGEALDIVSFHSYLYYAPGQPNPIGPSVDWRVHYLRDLLARYGVPDRPLLRTETALLCPQVTAACRWSQADTLARSYMHAMRDNLLGNLWYIYDNDSFHNTAMIEPSEVFVPRPAYFAYRHAIQMLGAARYVGVPAGVPSGVEAYQLRNPDGSIVYMAWSDAPSPPPLTLPVPAGRTSTCTNRDGGAAYCLRTSGRVTIYPEQSPQYVLLR